MAWTKDIATATATDIATTTPEVLTTGNLGATVNVGDLIVVHCSRDNQAGDSASPTDTLADNKGNTYSTAVGFSTAGAANRNAGILFYCTAAQSIASGGPIVYTWNIEDAAAIATKVINVAVHRPGNATGGTPIVTNSAEVLATTTPSVTATGVTSGDLVVGCVGLEEQSTTVTAWTRDSDTTNGSWSDPAVTVQSVKAGTVNDNASCMQAKVTTGTGDQTYNPTINTTNDTTCLIASFRENVPPSAPAECATVAVAVDEPTITVSSSATAESVAVGATANEASSASVTNVDSEHVAIGAVANEPTVNIEEASGENAPAECATVAVAAEDATVTVSSTADSEHAAATVTANDAVATVSANATAEDAAVTVTVEDATVTVTGAANATAEDAAVTATANDATITVSSNATAEHAAVTVTANDASSVSATNAAAECATVTVEALDAGINLGGTDTDADAECATVTVTALNAAVDVALDWLTLTVRERRHTVTLREDQGVSGRERTHTATLTEDTSVTARERQLVTLGST